MPSPPPPPLLLLAARDANTLPPLRALRALSCQAEQRESRRETQIRDMTEKNAALELQLREQQARLQELQVAHGAHRQQVEAEREKAVRALTSSRMRMGVPRTNACHHNGYSWTRATLKPWRATMKVAHHHLHALVA